MTKTKDQLPTDYTDAQLAEAYDNIRSQETDIAATKQILAGELLSRLKNDGAIFGNYTVSKVKRYSIDVDRKDKQKAIEKFKLLGAVKTKEDFDMDVIKALFFKKIELPFPVKISESVLVKLIESDE